MIGSPFHISCPEIFHDDEKVFKYMHDKLSCFIYCFPALFIIFLI